MERIISLTGILLVMIGTVFSLWSILTTRTSSVGTYGDMDGKKQQYVLKKQKREVFIGTLMICMGSMLQCVAMFL